MHTFAELFKQILNNRSAIAPFFTQRVFASGRWWPQPQKYFTDVGNATSMDNCRCKNFHSDHIVNGVQKLEQFHKNENVTDKLAPESQSGCGDLKENTLLKVNATDSTEIILDRESAAPVYEPTQRKPTDGNTYRLVQGRNGEMLSNYVLFKDSMDLAKVPWTDYSLLSSEERGIYMAHLKAVKDRKLWYSDPKTGYHVFTVSKLLTQPCCGNGCRHCPYEHENASDEIGRSQAFKNCFRYERSRHRSRPPNPGITRLTRLIVVDNSAIGKEANLSGKLAYCIHVYKPGFRKKHMPCAELGDKVLVAIRGELKKAIIVGTNTHWELRKHGVPSTDTNNIVLLNDEGNPLSNRILAPLPAPLLLRRDSMVHQKILTLVKKFV